VAHKLVDYVVLMMGR